jgi:hypothetical protein
LQFCTLSWLEAPTQLATREPWAHGHELLSQLALLGLVFERGSVHWAPVNDKTGRCLNQKMKHLTKFQ